MTNLVELLEADVERLRLRWPDLPKPEIALLQGLLIRLEQRLRTGRPSV